MADKRRAAKEKTDKGIDAALRDLPRKGVQNPLLSTYLRKDAAKTAAGERFRKFRDEDLATRYAKRAETSGLLDLLTFLPAGRAASALRGKEFLPAALAGGEFLSQFGDDPFSRLTNETLTLLPSTRGLSKLASGTKGAEFTNRLGQDWLAGTVGGAAGTLAGMDFGPRGQEGENLSAFPVFGSTTGRLRQAVERMARTGKDLPQFSAEGKISPRRQLELEARMREMIPLLGSRNPEKVESDLNEWIKSNPFWGKYPLQKEPLLDLMPASLRAPFYQGLKGMGYGGVKMGSRDFGTARPDFRPGKETIEPGSSRKWEDILKFEQGGGIPTGFAATGRQPQWVARPGETLSEGQTPFSLAKSAAGAGLLGAALAGTEPEGEDSQAAVPGWKKLQRLVTLANSGRLADPIKTGRVPGSPLGLPGAYKSQRFENLADILPSSKQRRGMYYTITEPQTSLGFNLQRPSGAYQNDFSNLLSPGSEGGSRGVLGQTRARNPLLLDTSSFFGNEAPDVIGKGRKLRGANSWEELNKQLPKKYRLNNTDIRNFKNDPNRKYSWGDTVGDLILAKYMKKEGLDMALPKSRREYMQKNPGWLTQFEAVFPSASRWDTPGQFTSNWKTMADYAAAGPTLPPQVELELLKRGRDVAKSKTMAAGAGASKLDQFAAMIGAPIPQKTKMTKAERIAKWGNPGIKQKTGSIYFTSPDDFLNYRLPDNSWMAKKDPHVGWLADTKTPLVQQFLPGKSGGSGGPKLSFGIPAKDALEFAKKGAKPYLDTFYAAADDPDEIIEELKKYFPVLKQSR